ncbi:SGNH/GDSL hydrolase family protein [Paenibacillus sp. Marseille-Q4541]|uniref:SGNH/GDSL hydrolase family protein n=1 Tax=Paenibacillus sp. Marseille-Q4541 TaxID=2831522 RepID=UPI001BAAFE12|nr:SGNH/GDSL hydrolase family protein [Paenibacillus sp. Marseille-Q4541]
MTIPFEHGDTVLFIGDSITDCGRDYGNKWSLGGGYALLTAAEIGRRYPQQEVKVLNRGINGHRVTDLAQRWQQDCIAHQPDWLSIYIGINDTWRHYDSGQYTSPEDFYRTYRDLLVQTKEQTKAKIVLIEPFVLPVPEDRKKWREDLDPKIQVIRELAREFKTRYVPLDGLFAANSTQVDPAYWAEDGVHPTPAGHALISKAWLEAVHA